MNRILFILRKSDERARRKVAGLLHKHVPLHLRKPLTERIFFSGVLHQYHLRSLDILGTTLGGLVLFEHLMVVKDFLHLIADYLPRLTAYDVGRFADFAASLLNDNSVNIGSKH